MTDGGILPLENLQAISVVIENTSGGNNTYAFNTIVYELQSWP